MTTWSGESGLGNFGSVYWASSRNAADPLDGTEIRIFAYLQNTRLVVCFLGLGLGCFTSRKPIVMRDMLLRLFSWSCFWLFP